MWLSIGAGFCVAAVGVSAAFARSGPRAMSLVEALSRAAESSFDVRRARADAGDRWAEARRVEAGPMLAPEAQVLAGPCWGGGAFTGCIQTQLAFPLPIPGEGRARARVSGSTGAMAEASIEAASALARWRALDAYLEARVAVEMADFARAARALAAETLRATRIRMGMGASAELDVVQAEALVAARARESAEAEAAVGLGAQRLRRALGAEVAITPSDGLHTVFAYARRQLTRAAVVPLWVQLARAQARVVRARAELARRQVLPRVSLLASYQRDDAIHQALVGVQIPLTFGSSVPRAEVEAKEARARALETAAELDVAAWRQRRALAEVALAGRRVVRARVEAELRHAERVLVLSRRGYSLGQVSLFRVIAAENAVVRTRRALLWARRDEGRALVRVLAGGDA